MSLQPFLCLANMEVSNGVRVLAYLRTSDLAGYLQLGVSHSCIASDPPVQDGNYASAYTTLYPAAHTQPDPAPVSDAPTRCLACYCAALDEAFVSVAADPAPWYVASRPESAEFYGFFAGDINLDTPIARSMSRRASGGGVLSPATLGPRVVSVSGLLFASTPRGMNYGQRWLADVLRGSLCDMDCDGDTLGLLPTCLPSDATDVENDAAFRTLYDAAVIDPPVYEHVVDRACLMQKVSFQLGATNPYLHAPAVTVIDETVLRDDSACATITTDEWTGDTALRITLTNQNAGRQCGSAFVKLYPLATGQSCDPDFRNAPVEFEVTRLNPGEQMVIDATMQTVTVYDPTSKRRRNGWGHLDFPGTFDWPVISPCTTACVCVVRPDVGSNDFPLHVLVEMIAREV